jgi:CCR4-NOT transcription complex subunit 2
LLNVIKMTNQDLNTLSLGYDLTTLGLNLNSSEYLYTTFTSPWSDLPSKIQPEYNIPTCYYMRPANLNTSTQHMTKYQEETLFYIFYSMPQDYLQILSAKEL